MKKIINWGLIGLGNASLNLANEFKNINNSTLLAVASHNIEKRKFYEKEFKLEKKNIFSNYEDIFKHPNIDIIYIGLPNSMHEIYCFKALQYKKNIIVEKPITKNIEVFRNLKKKFIEKNLLLEEATANKFHPFYAQALKEINKLDCSRIFYIKSNFGNDALGGKKIFGLRLKRINHNKRVFNKKLDGGSILDGGIYPISFLVDVMHLLQNNFINNFTINNCKKKISNDVDIESVINFKLNNIEIELKTSLINSLNNNFEVHTKDEIITFKNIFTIDASSAVIYGKNDHKNITNKNNNSVYFYEIKEISNLIINKNNNISTSLNKLEDKIEILSAWHKY